MCACPHPAAGMKYALLFIIISHRHMDLTALLMIKYRIMKDLMNDIKTGNFRNAYLLYGAEDYLRRLMTKRLTDALIPDGNSINLSSWSGSAVTEGAVIDQGETLPFFSDRRVICLDHTGFFTVGKKDGDASGETGALAEYVKNLPEYLVLIFTEESADKRSRLFKAVQKYGRVVEFPEQTEETLTGWILKMLDAEHLKIRKPNMEYLLGRTGTGMTRIRLETDKLIHFCQEEGLSEVTREAITEVTTGMTEDRIFDMIAAITEHRIRTAMNLYGDLLSLKEPPMRILMLTGRQYRQLMAIKELDSEGLGQQQIAAALSIHPYAVKKSLPLAKRYTSQQLRDAVVFCADMEEDVKTGRISEEISVTLVIIRLAK